MDIYLAKCFRDDIVIPVYFESLRSLCSFIQNNMFFYDKIIILDLEKEGNKNETIDLLNK